MKNLVQIRVSRGLSQEYLSKLSGLSQATISQIEQGKSYPQAQTRYKLEIVLGPIDWMSTKLHGNHLIELSAGL